MDSSRKSQNMARILSEMCRLVCISPYGLKQRATNTPLEGLVHAEGQHHEGDKDGTEVFSAPPLGACPRMPISAVFGSVTVRNCVGPKGWF